MKKLRLLLLLISCFTLTGCGDDSKENCHACDGTGYYNAVYCPICKGEGKVDPEVNDDYYDTLNKYGLKQ